MIGVGRAPGKDLPEPGSPVFHMCAGGTATAAPPTETHSGQTCYFDRFRNSGQMLMASVSVSAPNATSATTPAQPPAQPWPMLTKS